MFLDCNQNSEFVFKPVSDPVQSTNTTTRSRRIVVLRMLLPISFLLVSSGKVLAQATVLESTPTESTPFTSSRLDYQPSLKTIEVEGNTRIPSQRLLMPVQEFIGKSISASDIEEIRTRLTRVYVDAGYINSGALFMMPNSLANPISEGRLRFKVIEGHLQKIHIQGQQDLNPDYIRKRLYNTNEVLNMHDLREQFQLLLQDPLFDRIQSRLLPTGQLGQAVLELDVVRKPAYSYTISTNNYRSPAIGEAVLASSVTVLNLSGWGDTLDAQVGKSSGATPYHLGWSFPLYDGRQNLQISWDQGRSNVVEAPLDLVDIHSQISALELRWNQNLMNSLARRIDFGFALANKRTRSSLLGEDFSFSPGEVDGRSRTQVVKFTQDWSERAENMGLLVHSAVHVGRNNNVDGGAADAQEIPPRRYWLWNGQIQWLRQLPDWNAQLLLRAQAQWSPMRLIPMEKMVLGGNSTVRGFREGSLLRDQAQVVSVELHKNLFEDAEKRQQFSAFVFVDGGRAKNHTESSQNLSSYGLGLKVSWNSYFADLVLGKRLHTPKNLGSQKQSTLQDQGIQLQLAYRFD